MKNINTSKARALTTLALEAGIKDTSYITHSSATVTRFEGECIIKLNGRYYLAVGKGPTGDASVVSAQGRIGFKELSAKDAEMVSTMLDRNGDAVTATLCSIHVLCGSHADAAISILRSNYARSNPSGCFKIMAE